MATTDRLTLDGIVYVQAEEAAEATAMSVQHLRKLARDKVVPARHIGRRVWFDLQGVFDALAQPTSYKPKEKTCDKAVHPLD